MCGLFGVAGDLSKKDLDAFMNLMWCSGLRGMDSVGVAQIEWGKLDQVMVMKQIGGPEQFMDRRSFLQTINTGAAVLIGHTRSRTQGEVSKENAHPFEFDTLVGAHNGTLEYASKNRLEGPGVTFKTDSEALFSNLNKTRDITKTLGDVKGAFALEWYDKKEHTLNFIRNPDRPFYYVHRADGKALYWASEVAMLYLCLNRQGVDIDKVKILKEYTLLQFPLPNRYGKFDGTRRTIERIPFDPPTVNRSGIWRSGQWHGREPEDLASVYKSEGKELIPFVPRSASSSPNRVARKPDEELFNLNRPEENKEWGRHYTNKDGIKITHEGFAKAVAGGCGLCSEQPIFGESILWGKEGNYVCGACTVEHKDEQWFEDMVSAIL